MERKYLHWIIGGVLIILIAQFFLNLTSSFEVIEDKYVTLEDSLAHYELLYENTTYVEILERTYTIKTPFVVLPFNSKVNIQGITGYNVWDITPDLPNDCLDWPVISTKGQFKVKVKTSQFKVPTCTIKFLFKKDVNKNLIVLPSSQSWGYDGVSYNDSGLTLRNYLNEPVKGFIFHYYQENYKGISVPLSQCANISVLLNNEKVDFRTNFFENNSIVAVKLDFAPLESKDFIVRCNY